MEKIIVPIDFSDASLNAAQYAVKMAVNISNAEVILYNTFDATADSLVNAAVEADIEEMREQQINKLQNLQVSLFNIAPAQMRSIAEAGILEECLPNFADKESADLIIMGITPITKFEQSLYGSHSLNILNLTDCPVLIVPIQASYNELDQAMLASDFKNVAETVPAKVIRKFISLFNTKLHIVNIDSDHYVELKDEYKEEKKVMDNLFEGINPEYAFLRFFDFEEGINTYANDHNIKVMIMIPRKHTFLERILQNSHTKQMAFESKIPLLAVHN